MWFDEILEDHDKRMGYEYDDPWKADDTKMWSFKVKSKASDTSLSCGQDIVKNNSGGYDCKHKTELKTKLNDEWKVEVVSSNKEHEVEFQYKPTSMNKDGQEVEVAIEAKCQPNKSTWAGEVQLNAGGFDLGPLKPWTTLKFETDDKQAHKVKYTQNLVYEKDYHAACEVNLNADMAVSSAYAYLAMIGPNGNYYLRSQLMNWFVGAGTWWQADNNGAKHSLELQYDAKDNKSGMFGNPLFLRYGFKYPFSSVVTYSTQMMWGARLTGKDKGEYKVNDNFKVTYTGVYDVMDVLTNSENADIKMGFGAELNL